MKKKLLNFYNIFKRKIRPVLNTSYLIPHTSYFSPRAQRGSNLLETLLAIGLVAAMTPFVYNRIAETSRDIADVSVAKQIYSWRELMSGYIRRNQADWPEDTEMELDEKEMRAIRDAECKAADNGEMLAVCNSSSAMFPAIAFVERYAQAGGTIVDAYLVFPAVFDGLRMRKIARALGVDAAVADASGVAYSASGGWSVESEQFGESDLVYRVSVYMARDDSALFMHRMKSDDGALNTMERDLLMSRHSLVDADVVRADSLDSKMVAAWFATADMLNAEAASFPDGANLDPSGASFADIRVLGDVIGFRSITTGNFGGAGGSGNWSAQGNVIADRTKVTGAVHVGRNLSMRSPYYKTITGFTGVNANSVSVPFLSTERLFFANGFGMSISNELSASYGTGPLKLGNWAFPSSVPPVFKTIVLRKADTDIIAPAPAGFDNIMSSGWKTLRAKE